MSAARLGIGATMLLVGCATAILAQPTTRVSAPSTLPAPTNLPAAPPVNATGVQPSISEVLAGTPITITGTDFLSTIAVRLGAHTLPVVSKSATHVTVRAPSEDDVIWGTTNFRAGQPLVVGHPNGEPRVLNSTFKVFGRWDATPRLVSAVVRSVSGDGAGRSAGVVVEMDLTLEGVPGNRLDSVSTGGGFVPGTSCNQRLDHAVPSRDFTAGVHGGRLAFTYRVSFRQARAGPCALQIPLWLSYRSAPPVDRRLVVVDLGTHAVPEPFADFAVANTYQAVTAGLLRATLASGSNSSCSSGGSTGATGVRNIDGDLTFVLSDILALRCDWVLSASLAAGWSIHQLVFASSQVGVTSSSCRVLGLGSGSVSGAVLEEAASARTVSLECAGLGGITSRLERIVVRGPAGATDWQSATR